MAKAMIKLTVHLLICSVVRPEESTTPSPSLPGHKQTTSVPQVTSISSKVLFEPVTRPTSSPIENIDSNTFSEEQNLSNPTKTLENDVISPQDDSIKITQPNPLFEEPLNFFKNSRTPGTDSFTEQTTAVAKVSTVFPEIASEPSTSPTTMTTPIPAMRDKNTTAVLGNNITDDENDEVTGNNRPNENTSSGSDLTPAEMDHECWWKNQQKIAAVLISLSLATLVISIVCARSKGYCLCSRYEDITRRSSTNNKGEYQENIGVNFHTNGAYDPL